VIIGSIFYIRRKPAPIIEKTKLAKEKPEEIDIADWKIYRNEEFGFEINIRNDWYVKLKLAPL